MNCNLCLLLATAVLAAPALVPAQRPLVLPAEYNLAWGRGSSSALGGSSTRTQMIFAQPFPRGTPVFGVGLRPTASTSDRAAFTADVEVRMSSTANAPGALSATFASNVGSDVVVAFPRQTLNVPAMPANRSTGLFARVPFATPFLFGTNGNTNVNVDLLVYGRSSGASWSTDRGFAAAGGRATNAGSGCGAGTVTSTTSGGSASYAAGATVTVSLANAPATSPAILVPSVNMRDYAPGALLPFDLGLVGAGTGCDLLVAPSGSNPAGLETTANRAIWIGPEAIVPHAQYVWDLSNVNNATGNASTDSVPVVLFLIP